MALLSIQSRHGAGVSRMSWMHYRKKPNVDNNIVIAVASMSDVFFVSQPCLCICVEIKDDVLEHGEKESGNTSDCYLFFCFFFFSLKPQQDCLHLAYTPLTKQP